jgi:hypothetical protein
MSCPPIDISAGSFTFENNIFPQEHFVYTMSLPSEGKKLNKNVCTYPYGWVLFVWLFEKHDRRKTT